MDNSNVFKSAYMDGAEWENFWERLMDSDLEVQGLCDEIECNIYEVTASLLRKFGLKDEDIRAILAKITERDLVQDLKSGLASALIEEVPMPE